MNVLFKQLQMVWWLRTGVHCSVSDLIGSIGDGLRLYRLQHANQANRERMFVKLWRNSFDGVSILTITDQYMLTTCDDKAVNQTKKARPGVKCSRYIKQMSTTIG